MLLNPAYHCLILKRILSSQEIMNVYCKIFSVAVVLFHKKYVTINYRMKKLLTPAAGEVQAERCDTTLHPAFNSHILNFTVVISSTLYALCSPLTYIICTVQLYSVVCKSTCNRILTEWSFSSLERIILFTGLPQRWLRAGLVAFCCIRQQANFAIVS